MQLWITYIKALGGWRPYANPAWALSRPWDGQPTDAQCKMVFFQDWWPDEGEKKVKANSSLDFFSATLCTLCLGDWFLHFLGWLSWVSRVKGPFSSDSGYANWYNINICSNWFWFIYSLFWDVMLTQEPIKNLVGLPDLFPTSYWQPQGEHWAT